MSKSVNRNSLRMKLIQLGACLFLLAACSKDPGELLESGKKYLAEGKYKEAAIQLKSAINANPQLAEAHYQLALTYLHLQQPRDAAQEFIKVALLDPNNLDAQLKAGNLLLLENKHDEAREKAQLVLDREPRNVNAMILLANTHAGIVSLNDSLQELRQAFETEPRLAPPFVELSGGGSFKPKAELAEELYKKAIATEPASVEAHLALTNLYIHTARLEEAETELNALLARDKTSRDTQQALAYLYVRTGRVDLAERIYVDLAESNKSNLSQRVILSQFFFGTGKADKAIEVLKDILRDDSSYAIASRRLGEIYLSQKQYDRALEVADEAIKRDGGDVDSRILKGRALLGMRRATDAQAEIQKVANARPAYAPGRYYLALAHFDSKNIDKAEAELVAAITADSSYVQAYVPLAEIKLNAGQADQAIKYARLALTNPTLVQARLILTRAYIAQQDFTSAANEVQSFLEDFPENAAGLHHAGLIKLAQSNYAEAEKLFERAVKAEPEAADSVASLADLYLRQKQADKAIARVNAAIAAAPANPAFYRIQAYTQLQLGNLPSAQEAFEKAVALAPADVNQRLDLADFYSTAGSYDKAIGVLETLAKDNNAQAKKRLLDAYLNARNYASALRVADETLAANAADVDALIAKGRALLAQDKTAEATQQLQKAVTTDTTSAAARYYLGHAYMAAKNTQAAESEWSDATKNSGGFLLPYVALSQLKLEAGDKETAARLARQALGMNARYADAQLILALSSGEKKDFARASEILEELVRKNPGDAVQRQRLGVAYLGQGDLPRAESEFENALRANPKSKDSVVGLVRIYLERNQTQQAVTKLNEQMNANPADSLWAMLAELHIRQKDFAKAEETYKRAVSLDAKDVNAKVALADFYLRTKRQANAAAVYDDLAKIGTEQAGLEAKILKGRLLLQDGKAAEAVTELQAAAKVQPKLPRLLYYLGLAYRQDNKFDLAEGSFSDAISADPRFVYAYLGLAQLKLSAGNPDQAIRHANEALKLDARLADAVLVKGNAQLAKGNTKDAVTLFEGLVQTVPGNSVALERLGTGYAAQGDLGKAEPQFQESLRLSPGNTDALAGLVRVYVQQKKPDLALKRVQQQLATSANDARLHEMLGEVYAVQKNFPKAEESYRKAISIDPGNFGAYGLLGQLFLAQNSTDKAIREFESALKANPRSVQAHIVLAVVHDMGGSFDKAKSHYREALKLDPQSPVAANNLAWLLAESGDNVQEALNLAQTASTKLPNQPNVMDTLGWVYYKTGAYASAVDVLKACVERAPNNASYQYHLGMSYLKLGDRSKAKTLLTQALAGERFPGADEARKALSTLQTP